MIELYSSPFSTCSQKVRLCLHEKAVRFTEHRMSFAKGEHISPDYLAINPNGVLPTLVHDGEPIIDSSVICEYLDETFPAPPLMPEHAVDRAHVRAWMRYVEEVPTAAVRPPSFNALFADANGAGDRESFEAHAVRLPLRKHFYLKMQGGRFDDLTIAESLERLGQTVARMEHALGANAWLAGDSFTLADLILVPLLARMEDIGLSSLLLDAPLTRGWLKRVQARPSFTAAFYPGSRIQPATFQLHAAERGGV